jgi:hypothetical protein
VVDIDAVEDCGGLSGKLGASLRNIEVAYASAGTCATEVAGIIHLSIY